MDKEKFVPYLKELAQKYAVAGQLEAELLPGAVSIQSEQGSERFVYDFAATGAPGQTPLLHWRSKRRYIELRNILEQKLVQTPLALRIHHIVPQDEFAQTLQDIFAYEADLAEFITGQPIQRVFADFSGGEYTNCILSTKGGIKVSMELGFSPAGSQPVLLHEVVAKTGVISDVAVDTQTQQHSLYVFSGPETHTYTDADSELYGLENTQADCIRFILWALEQPQRIPRLQAQARHLQAVWQAAEQASKNAAYTVVEAEA